MRRSDVTEKQLKEKKIAYKKGFFPFSANGKSLAQNESEGFSKLLTGAETGQILGAFIVGHHATELLGTVIAAMNGNLSAKVLEQAVFPHPTMSEIIKETAADVYGASVHVPKKADDSF